MNIQERKELLVRLGEFMIGDDEEWAFIKRKASSENPWFTPEFIELSIQNIGSNFLKPSEIQELIDHYNVPENNTAPKKIGIVMAGNIPLVGFHDLLCVFLTGHIALIKLSSKDEVLLPFLIRKLIRWNEQVQSFIIPSEMLKGCDAYIATGSNNSSRYFEYYFRNHPHIIRQNRTSVAVLTGNETPDELNKLADDVHLYFGLGCRNVTKVFVPEGYDFVPMLDAFNKYHYLINHNKYKNNYDYNLALHILNKRQYMTNGSILLVEDESPFSPISQLNYEYYTDKRVTGEKLKGNNFIQCIVGREDVNFGKAQSPGVCDFADGVDTMEFLMNL